MVNLPLPRTIYEQNVLTGVDNSPAPMYNRGAKELNKMTGVYLVRAGESQYKVGITSNIYKRVKALQTSNAHKIELITFKEVDQASVSESSIHASLLEFKTTGGKEWFKLEPAHVIELAIIINALPAATDADVSDLKELMEKQYLIQKKISGKLQSILDKSPNNTQPIIKTTQPKKIEKPKIIKPSIEQDIERALIVCKERGLVSTSFIQRKLSIGYGRASRIVDAMELAGIIGEPNGAKARELLI